MHKIEVIMEPDMDMPENARYFWCIMSWGVNTWYNSECGWSATPEQAFKDAQKAYHTD